MPIRLFWLLMWWSLLLSFFSGTSTICWEPLWSMTNNTDESWQKLLSPITSGSESLLPNEQAIHTFSESVACLILPKAIQGISIFSFGFLMKCKQVFKNNGCMSESTHDLEIVWRRGIRLLFDVTAISFFYDKLQTILCLLVCFVGSEIRYSRAGPTVAWRSRSRWGLMI